MSRTSLRAAAVVSLAALFAGTTTAFAADDSNPPVAVQMQDGVYVVTLDDAPVATYAGGVPGFAATKPAKGKSLDAHSANAKKYAAHLSKKQADAASAVGAKLIYSYSTALNGFAAKLTGAQAAKLTATPGVKSVVLDQKVHVDAVPSTDFLGLSGATGVWNALGGISEAGKGVVVGVVDTGISPEHASFAGDPLGTTPSATTPYLDGNQVVFQKSDGTQFRSDRTTGQQWGLDDYSTKLIGARYFSAGALAGGQDVSADYLSPRDGAGHGSHTASTAAGNANVSASISGVNFGTITGVAPAAKVAMYKACWEGPDPATTDDDGCYGSDLIAAINAATDDGVDVINYSIGGGSANTVLSADDYAFLNAAAAGIFVSASAGNSGPGASTADHASPWYTTVAASTIPTYEGTVQLPDGTKWAGATVTVPQGQTITGPSIYSGDAVASGAAAADAALCAAGSLDPAKVAGKIVVCDRGVIARVDKSATVAAAGGIGMILVNVSPSSLDNDFHSVPTIHIQNTARAALLAYVQGTPNAPVSLVSGNQTGIVTPTPQVAGFSSRGPMLTGGSDVIKPDISAPGVAILAATNNAEGAAPTFGFLSGTSMAAPHIAGIAALYLTAHPNASPAEIKSAMMTTAYNTVNASGAEATDPFAQGAGHVDPTKFLHPGLIYQNGVGDWLAYLQGQGYDAGATPIDASDLNLASIAIGSLAKEQTVTRTVTVETAGTYTAAVNLPGVTTTVTPSSFTAAAGDQVTFTVTFKNASAPVEQWATGFLTWTGPETARSPIAIYPVTADAPVEVSGTGLSGSVTVPVTSGVSGTLPLTVSGLNPLILLRDPAHVVKGHTGNEASGADTNGIQYWYVDVPAGTQLAQFTLDSSDDTGSDLDLYVDRVDNKKDANVLESWNSASGSADEQVRVFAPTPGTYRVRADVFGFTNPFTWDLSYANVGSHQTVGTLSASPNPLVVSLGEQTSYQLNWSKLQAGAKYVGLVQYGTSSVYTVLEVAAGSKH
ncbi:MAG TPA: S8 family serine peptidase [Candidatus Lumbricidophila sp.]|nr:S8 family serine peptidase [Candidatus Lumbricidophila sp.]